VQGVTPDGAALVVELGRLFSSLARVGDGHTDGSLTSTQKLLLSELVDSGPLRLGTLAERIGATDPTTSRAVDGLVAAGLVERRADPADRRAVLHVATTKGKTWILRRRTEVASVLDRALERLSPGDRARLLAMITKLNEALRAAGEQPLHHPALLASR
jgi:DNA-binding MarR family transcriptional regulator